MESPVIQTHFGNNTVVDHVNNLLKLSSKKIINEIYIYGTKDHDLPFPRGLSEKDKYVRIVLTLENKEDWEALLDDVLVIQKLAIFDCTLAILKNSLLSQLDLTFLQELELQRCKFDNDSIAKLTASRLLQKFTILGSQLTILKLSQTLTFITYARNVVLDLSGIPASAVPKLLNCFKKWKRCCRLDSLTLRSFPVSLSSKIFAKILNRIFSIEAKLILEFRRNKTGMTKDSNSDEFWLKDIRKKQKIYLKKEKYEGLASLEIEVIKSNDNSPEV